LNEGGDQPERTLAVKRESNGRWIGEPFSPDSVAWKKASPINHISPDDPPILLVHGKVDETVAYRQSVLMYDAMKPVQPATELLLLEDCGHNIRTSKTAGDAAWAATISYFREHLGEANGTAAP
jgi:dipeptidyl aminopeptidase/acylaminoacyl peptidase